MPATTQFWSTCLATFESELSTQQFNTWIKPLRLDGDEDGLQVLAPNRFTIQFVKDRFLSRIEDLAKDYFGKAITVTLALGGPPSTANPPQAMVAMAAARNPLLPRPRPPP